MKTVSILLLNQLNIGGLENARQGFLESNNYLRMMGKSPAFNVELVGSDKEVKVDEGLYAIRAQKNIRELSKTDIIVIPPIKGDKIQEAIEQNLAFLPWIVDQYHKGAEVVSLCLGAFILGASGLVDNKNCVTHWRAADQFRKHFPKTHLLTDKILTDEERIYTGGGAFSSANLVLYLIEKMVDRETAVYCSKHFQIDIRLRKHHTKCLEHKSIQYHFSDLEPLWIDNSVLYDNHDQLFVRELELKKTNGVMTYTNINTRIFFSLKRIPEASS